MVLLNSVLSVMMAASTATAYTWTVCKNVHQCSQVTDQVQGVSKLGHAGGRGRAGHAAGEIAKHAGEGAISEAGSDLYDEIFNGGGGGSGPSSQTRFSYAGDDGYWYSHDVDGLFVSPQGYFRPGGGLTYVAIWSKNGAKTLWQSGDDCCLPDEVGTGISDVMAYST